MDPEELRARIDSIFEPEPDEDSHVGYGDVPHPRLSRENGLDLSYLRTFTWEGSTVHPRTRICPTDAASVHVLSRNSDVPIRLFEAALRLFGDSVVANSSTVKRTGPLRFYPPVILTFWSGFETFVRYSSELWLATAKETPAPVVNFLTERESVLDRRGCLTTRSRYQPVLERYIVLLKYGYGYQVDRGASYWQRLEAAQASRDYYTHLDVKEPRSISSTQVLDFMESVFLGIISPSAHMKRTQLLGVYSLYWAWDSLRDVTEEFTEQPFYKDWAIGDEPYMFYCPFDGVDTVRFPNSEEDQRRFKNKAPG